MHLLSKFEITCELNILTAHSLGQHATHENNRNAALNFQLSDSSLGHIQMATNTMDASKVLCNKTTM